jgi:hypothetical protein
VALKGDDSKFSIATTVTLALAVAALVLVKEPLKSSRPAGSGMELNGASEELKVRARLWEDPFAAVQKDVESRKKSGTPGEITVIGEGTMSSMKAEPRDSHETIRMTARIQGDTSDETGLANLKKGVSRHIKARENITVLIVMTEGGPYSNAIETRIGDRYALQAALDVGCFAPEATEILRYFTWQFIKEPGAKPHGITTPYEWYGRNKTAPCGGATEQDDAVLLLWMKGEDYQGHIVKGLNDLIHQVLYDEITSGSLHVKVIGPRTSSEFEMMLREIEGRAADNQMSFDWPFGKEHLQMYSPWATAMPGLLAYGMQGRNSGKCGSYQSCKAVFEQLLDRAHIHLEFRINNDMVLFEELFRELERRQVAVGKDPIVLIGEWDSFYARALPITFSAAACRHIGRCQTSEGGVDLLMQGKIVPQDLHITRYNYLSGLDGESLDEQQKRPKSKNEEKEKENAGGKLRLRDRSLYEKPEGTSQLDYVRRLVSRVKSEERGGDSSHYRKVKAIGILGRDPYDALLILQAVREQFPTVLFFTTDLYARYFHDSEEKWARNLLIASHFGLQLEPQLQQSIPPFRNSYQTSTVLAVLKAINRLDTGRYHDEVPPRIFEIGRHGAVDLSVNPIPARGKSVHPPRDDVEPGAKTAQFPPGMWRVGILAVALLGMIIWCYAKFWSWLKVSEDFNSKAKVWMRGVRAAFVILPLLFICGLWIAGQVFDYDEDEPFSWSDGVSIWPTELLRLLAGLLCLWFMIKARVDLKESTSELTRRFFPSSSETGAVPRHGFWSNLEWMVHGTPYGKIISAADLWARYCDAHKWPQRVGRVALLFLVYFVTIWAIWPLLNDGEWNLFVPCRGIVSCGMDRIAILLSVIPLIALNLSVLDAVLLAARWIRELRRATGLSALSMARLIGERTRVVNRRILYPFIVLVIVIGARSHYFDNWDFPVALLVVLTAHSLVALASACILYMAAIKTRRRIVSDLESTRQHPTLQGLGQDYQNTRVRKTIDEIASIQQGAFVPLYQQPVVQATLVAAFAFLQYWVLGQ